MTARSAPPAVTALTATPAPHRFRVRSGGAAPPANSSGGGTGVGTGVASGTAPPGSTAGPASFAAVPGGGVPGGAVLDGLVLDGVVLDGVVLDGACRSDRGAAVVVGAAAVGASPAAAAAEGISRLGMRRKQAPPGHAVLDMSRCPAMVGVVTWVPAGCRFEPRLTNMAVAPGRTSIP